jgi:hypothetical protein
VCVSRLVPRGLHEHTIVFSHTQPKKPMRRQLVAAAAAMAAVMVIGCYAGGTIDASSKVNSNYVDASWNVSADAGSNGVFLTFTEFEVEPHGIWGLGCYDKVSIKRPNGLIVQLCGNFETNPGINFTVFANSAGATSTFTQQAGILPTNVFYFPDPWIQVRLTSDATVPSYFKALYFSGNNLGFKY